MVRKSRGWSMERLGHELGITKQTVHSIEYGESNPSYEVLKEMERVFYPLKHDYLLAEVEQEKEVQDGQ